ncbi:50S ribosomal protein L9 [Aureispira]|jgi:large subunit ribosomal protein L9|nr:50S ribosomal protein L9 [Aureispira sp.]
MEIILLKDVEHVGMAKSLVNVKAGHARNYLIPQGLAIVANKANKNSLMQEIMQQKEKAAKILEEAKVLAEKLTQTTLKVPAKSGTSGKIFGSISTIQLSKILKETFGIEVNRKDIKLPEDVKMLGTYSATIMLHKELHATVKFEVFDDKEEK